jgi:precorrin-2/cobalt-factor-2 C20-methyltransferase
MSGMLYGIGVGPGDPDYLTLAAADRLKHVDVVLAASSTRNEYSTALNIARPHLPADARVELLKFPMTKKPDELEAAWRENAARTADLLDQGLRVAFLTLGDPMLYSTFGYLLRTLKRERPDQAVEIIPGVTSFQAAAAKTQTILAESGENLVVFSGVGDEARLERLMDEADNMVILKSYKNFEILRELVERKGLGGSTVFVSRLGLQEERIHLGLDEVKQTPHYLSLLLVTNTDKGEGGDG